ncbi:hypothetical protein E1180_11255 [Roseibium denhamense]|uniref:PilZ domain-containing protein n=1 Tax=Roseibium denhamense TaxID=76305 RepID=A0ABY1N621_9HYPH|nr:hypothetical protein [Roseibium denhamense]MTI06090.1 hypothetical protein [Roseibium denhamense]SMP01188.1 hypothetical protein SAMN06265374_0342 [Roseibium denhamense]
MVEHALGDKPIPANRTRMRAGRFTDLRGTLITEATLFDLQNGDLGSVIPDEDMTLPDLFLVWDTREVTVTTVKIYWRQGNYLGLSYAETPRPLHLATDSLSDPGEQEMESPAAEAV